MEGDYRSSISPGSLTLYCGPMRCGKTLDLIQIANWLDFQPEPGYQFFKPSSDTRDAGVIKSRFGGREYPCTLIDPQHSDGIIEKMQNNCRVVLIDEVELFGNGIEETIEKLLLRNLSVAAAGLDLDFRGELFGAREELYVMSRLLGMADSVYKRPGSCDYDVNGKRCGSKSTRTQRLINGEPAPYNSPLIMIDRVAEGVTYQSRCLRHHDVPGKPTAPGTNP